MLEAISTDAAPAAVGPYSQAIQAGTLLFLSGQLGIDPASGRLVEGFAAQARQALANMAAILRAAGAGLEQVASVDVFVTNLEWFAEFNAVYAQFFGEHRPARAVVGVAALPLGALVEVRAVAVMDAGQGGPHA
ncbi:reactive intermediate/imine deaminase [Thermodesulfomicrobium sp. WS]|uniref:Rid family detoxifying hydrolase n=1 Tax=Thermodesulfomicrobium sp. WS TaxID=3004129 RepID=UPI00248FAC1D|nr:Rid family detoxifying hydrolase [Thermodesulfomicrobium sp. WS]BDV00970.1 reactive intermediate/imine deaminase [Thermodesulfomicrobium sp. WS]